MSKSWLSAFSGSATASTKFFGDELATAVGAVVWASAVTTAYNQMSNKITARIRQP